jgi:hypothetical protein
MGKELPRRMIEKGKVWEDAKAYVVGELSEHKEILYSDMVKELDGKYKFSYKTAPYGVVKSLVKLGRVHYSRTGPSGRYIALGPGTGDIKITSEKEEEMSMVKDGEKPEAQERPDLFGLGPMMTPAIEPVEEEVPEAAPMVVSAVEIKNGPTVVAPEPKSVPLTEEEREHRAMEQVTRETARKILASVDKELERALSPEVRAQLRLVYAMANEAGMGLQRAASPLTQRDVLKKLFG